MSTLKYSGGPHSVTTRQHYLEYTSTSGETVSGYLTLRDNPDLYKRRHYSPSMVVLYRNRAIDMDFGLYADAGANEVLWGWNWDTEPTAVVEAMLIDRIERVVDQYKDEPLVIPLRATKQPGDSVLEKLRAAGTKANVG